jgi:3-deoxy-manno-octulosonate cytidylyltransferase (CMP-KDO synthetase)
MRRVIVIPARMAATRFPGKPLADILGRPMVMWVVDAARASGVGERVIVATPDQEIVDACASFGAEAMLTSEAHPTGTDRIAEVAATVEADVYVNVQGDEPLVRPSTIQACAAAMWAGPSVGMASVYSECPAHEYDDPSVVKVVLDQAGYALYFSRHAIPYARNPRAVPVWKHAGLYAFRRETLLEFAGWGPSALEQSESLEQLRFLENGVRIRMSLAQGAELAVDTPEQADEVRRLLAGRS